MPAPASPRQQEFWDQLRPDRRVLLFLKEEPQGFSLVGGLRNSLIVEDDRTALDSRGAPVAWRRLEASIRERTGLPPPAPAGAVIVPRSVEELTKGSAAIVVGRVRSITPKAAAFDTVETAVSLDVEVVIKGRNRSEVTVVLPGGRLGNLEQLDGGVPTFLPGERVLLFLRDDRASTQLAQLWQGRYTLLGSEAVQVETGQRQPLAELAQRIGDVIGTTQTPIPASDGAFEAPFVTWTSCNWPVDSLPHPVFVNEASPGPGASGADFAAISFLSLFAWQDLPDSYFAALYMGSTSRTGAAAINDGLNDVRWADLDGTFGTSTLGVNTCITLGGVRVDSDTRIDNTGHAWDPDDSNGISVGSFSLEAVLEHEFGHALGLSHSLGPCDGGPATPLMCSSIASGFRKTILSDDQAGAAAVYPLSGSVPGTPTSLAGSLASGSATLTWSSGPGPAPLAYEVDRAAGSCSGSPVFAVAGTSATEQFVDSDFDSGLGGGPFCYRIKALGIGGDSAFSVAAEVSSVPLDSDGDGYTDLEEGALGTNPNIYCATMRADVDDDGAVTILDLSAVAAWFASAIPPAPTRYDQNGNANIEILDFALMGGVFLQSVAACP